MQPLRLQTFGGLVLETDDGPVTGTATQRHRLALFALLTAPRTRGMSRDKVLAYLWPERDAEHARHRLNQLLYEQRRYLGGEELFLGKKTLRLNPKLIGTDVWEFADALDARAYEVAVRLYAGPFLDGFFLKGALQFERWVEGERDRLAHQCAMALAALASAATAVGNHRGAVEWWYLAADLNPLDSDVAVNLVEACVAAGNRAAAVRHAEAYEQRLKQELGLAPDPRIARLTEQLRDGSGR